MKLYVILTPTLAKMGGAQMYTYNKCQFLENNGWKVAVLYYIKEEILIKYLEKYQEYYYPELGNGIKYQSKSTVNKVIEQVSQKFAGENYEDVVVESQLQLFSTWGELIAERLNGRHILNCLEEDIPPCTKKEAKFFEFKLYRGEVLNASVKSLKRLFQSYYEERFKEKEFSTSFFCSNVTSTDNSILYTQGDADYTILSIGRLNKPYIIPMVKQIVDFAKEYSYKIINLMFIGGTTDDKIGSIIDGCTRSVNNLKVYHYGNMFPIPLQLLSFADVAIATSNSVLVPYQNKIPTIAMDARDNMPIGVYGVTTQNRVFRYGDEVLPLTHWLKKILIDNQYRDFDVDNKDSFEEVFGRQLRFLEDTSKERCYYDVKSIYSPIEHLIARSKEILSKFIKK